MAEHKLVRVITTETLITLGFKEDHDGSQDPRGTSWHIKNDKFHLYLDAWADVYLCRVNPDTDPVQLQCDSVHELEMVISWIKD